jgi:hypothetical protein
MGKRLFLVLPVLFVFSFLFIQVSEAVEYEYTVTKIGFYSNDEDDIPDDGTIIDLPSPAIVHEIFNESSNPNISNFIYQGNIPNGNWIGIGLYVTASTDPNYEVPIWAQCVGDIVVTDTSRKLLTIQPVTNGYPTVTVTDL